MISEARNEAYLCNYEKSHKMLKEILETIHQEIIINNSDLRKI